MPGVLCAGEVLGRLRDAQRQGIAAGRQGAFTRGCRAVGPGPVVLIPVPLAALQVLGVRGERRQVPFSCGPLEERAAALQRLTELLLRSLQVLKRVARGLRVKACDRSLKLLEPLGQFRCEGPLQELSHVVQTRGERSVPRSGYRLSPRKLIERVHEPLGSVLKLPLRVGNGRGPLARLEGECGWGSLWSAGRVGRKAPRTLGREIPGTVREGRGRLRQGGHRVPEIPSRGVPSRGAQRRETRQQQRDLGTASLLRLRCVVPSDHLHPQRVSGEEPPVRRVEHWLEQDPVARRSDEERFVDRFLNFPRLAHAPADDLHARDSVIVVCVDDELLAERERQRDVMTGHGHQHDRSGIGDHAKDELGIFAL